MASRAWSQFQGTLEKGVIKLYAHLTFGSSAVTLTAKPRNKGIASVSRTSAGLYVLTLDDAYVRLLAFNGAMIATNGIPGAPDFAVKIDGFTAATPTKAITFTTGTASGGSGAYVATDPTDTDIALIEITLSNSAAI